MKKHGKFFVLLL